MTKRAICSALAVFIFSLLAAVAQTTHVIAAGETLYRLSRHYGIKVEAICEANPGLSADNFKAGTEILIPAVTQDIVVTEVSQPAPQLSVRTTHTVAKKETLYGIARQYGITVQQLLDVNDMTEGTKLKKGMVLKIPAVMVTPLPSVAEPTNEQLMPAVKAESKRHIDMGVLLPLKVGDARSHHMLEFYRGVLMAVDSIKHRGVSVDVHAIEAGTTAADMRFVLSSHPELKQMDFIIGPQPLEQLATLSQFARENKVRLVVPFASQCGDEIKDNPYLYAVTAQKSQMEEGVCALARDIFTNHNVVVMHVAGEDADSRSLVDRLAKAFSAKGQKPNTLANGASETEMLATFNQFRDNLVLVPANSQKAVTQLYSTLENFSISHPGYKISVLGYPEWQNYTSQHLQNYYAYDTYLYTTSFRHPLSPAMLAFEKKYMLWARRPMSATTPRFGLMGFDVAWYFLCGISRYGAALESHLADVKPQPFQHSLTFERVSTWGGFTNNRVKMIHYKPSQTIDLLEKK